ncbi:MAG: hypothetical protein JRK53_25285 [Deltaproteobacteria bacterium]|nr:hypothetical protein [Deltaproteobacteria bacterium]MBW1817413.1 hypothetical protein [Deltaproteobacteria bacterium]
MAKPIQNPKDIFPDITQDLRETFGDDLVSIVLYGSAAGKHYRPGKSDINFMVVLSDAGIHGLDRAFPLIKKWRKRKVAVPLFLTERYVETSLDVFPIEYLNFQLNYVPVYGKNILEDLNFDRDMVRLQCEREIKGKLLILREAFLETAGEARRLKNVAVQSLGAFLAIFEALLYLRDQPFPEDRREIFRAVAASFDLDASVFEALLDIKEEKRKVSDGEMLRLFGDYLKAAENLSIIVDEMGGKDE